MYQTKVSGGNMDNNDRLIRIRYALDIKDNEMKDIFAKGGLEFSDEEIRKLLIKSQESLDKKKLNQFTETTTKKSENPNLLEENLFCTNLILETFLNGLVIEKRGVMEVAPNQAPRPAFIIKEHGSVNNVMLKKIKIALNLTSDDIIAIIQSTGVSISKGELGAFFRKRNNPKYVECGDKYARHFLKGLALRYRKD